MSSEELSHHSRSISGPVTSVSRSIGSLRKCTPLSPSAPWFAVADAEARPACVAPLAG